MRRTSASWPSSWAESLYSIVSQLQSSYLYYAVKFGTSSSMPGRREMTGLLLLSGTIACSQSQRVAGCGNGQAI